nr:serine/threonine-protein kinase [Kofleriaceae bacterium]
MGLAVGNYTIAEPLAAGGMGTIYRAVHNVLGRNAAVKLLRPDLGNNHELVSRFFKEAKAASAIHHPGIVEVFDFGFADGGDHDAYLVMELLDGVSLGRRLADKKRLTEVHAGVIARGVASALGAAHAKGIIHRDLKPDNVFLVPDPDVPFGERPKVLDFGIAKLSDALAGTRSGQTQTGALIGTPHYMAPEQAQAASAIDHRADLYSLGCLLYEMLVGEPPFVAEGAGEVIALQMFAQPTRVSARLSSISPHIEAITMRLLEKDPAARFQSAAEVVDALASIVGTLSSQRAVTLATADMPRFTMSFTPRPDVSSPGLAGGPMAPMMAERPSEIVAPPRRGSAMAIIAGALVVAIATVAVAVIATTHGDDAAATPAHEPAPQKVVMPAPPQPPAPPPVDPGPQPVPDKVVAPAPPPTTPVVRKTPPPTTTTTVKTSKPAGKTIDGLPFETEATP